jgi:hypothetical protein
MTYPFAGEIRMTKVVKDGQEVIEWEEVKWDASAPLIMGEPVECMRITPGNGGEFAFTKPATEWARVDKDLNVTHLDLDLCFQGPQNEYTALAKAIWNKAMEEAAKVCEQAGIDGYGTLAAAAMIRARGEK